MLDTAIVFLKNELSQYLKIKTGEQRDENDYVQFASIDLPRTVTLTNNSIAMILLNIEEERLFRSASIGSDRLAFNDRFEGGARLDLTFHLFLIANWKPYQTGLKYIFLAVKFFREYREFTRRLFPALPADIHHLSIDQVNLSFLEQAELWRALELPYNPSALFRVRMSVVTDAEIDEVETDSVVRSIELVRELDTDPVPRLLGLSP